MLDLLDLLDMLNVSGVTARRDRPWLDAILRFFTLLLSSLSATRLALCRNGQFVTR